MLLLADDLLDPLLAVVGERLRRMLKKSVDALVSDGDIVGGR